METLKTIFTRQSVRSYSEQQITREQLETILKAACAAPVGNGRYENVHLTVLQNKSLLEKITLQAAKVTGNPDARPFYGAPTVILVSSLPGKAIMYANVACLVENMALAAADQGLGSVYLWGFIDALNQNAELVKALNMPDGFVPVSAIAIGYSTNPLEQREISLDKIGINYLS